MRGKLNTEYTETLYYASSINLKLCKFMEFKRFQTLQACHYKVDPGWLWPKVTVKRNYKSFLSNLWDKEHNNGFWKIPGAVW